MSIFCSFWSLQEKKQRTESTVSFYTHFPSCFQLLHCDLYHVDFAQRAGKEKDDKEEEDETACKRARQEKPGEFAHLLITCRTTSSISLSTIKYLYFLSVSSNEGKSEKTVSLVLLEKQLLLVAQQLGREWKQVAIHLDLKMRDLEDLEDAEESVTMQKQKMLLKWKGRRKPGEATAYHLLESLKDMKVLPNEVHEILKG